MHHNTVEAINWAQVVTNEGQYHYLSLYHIMTHVAVWRSGNIVGHMN